GTGWQPAGYRDRSGRSSARDHRSIRYAALEYQLQQLRAAFRRGVPTGSNARARDDAARRWRNILRPGLWLDHECLLARLSLCLAQDAWDCSVSSDAGQCGVNGHTDEGFLLCVRSEYRLAANLPVELLRRAVAGCESDYHHFLCGGARTQTATPGHSVGHKLWRKFKSGSLYPRHTGDHLAKYCDLRLPRLSGSVSA